MGGLGRIRLLACPVRSGTRHENVPEIAIVFVTYVGIS